MSRSKARPKTRAKSVEYISLGGAAIYFWRRIVPESGDYYYAQVIIGDTKKTVYIGKSREEVENIIRKIKSKCTCDSVQTSNCDLKSVVAHIAELAKSLSEVEALLDSVKKTSARVFVRHLVSESKLGLDESKIVDKLPQFEDLTYILSNISKSIEKLDEIIKELNAVVEKYSQQ